MYTITTKTIIESATLELTGQQLELLARAGDRFDALLSVLDNDAELFEDLRPLISLAKAAADSIAGATIAPAKKKLTGGAAHKSRLDPTVGS